MKDVVRVLHVVQRMEAGGTQALLMNIYRKLDRNKVQFDFLVEYPNKEFYDDEILSMGGKIYYTNIRKDYNVRKFEKQLEKILKENPQYKIIHVHVSTIGYICFKVAKRMGIQVRIAHAHNNSSVRDIKYIPRAILRKLFVISATDFFACSSEAGEYFFKNKNYNVLKNAIDTNEFSFNEEFRKNIRNELGLEKNFVIGHVGRLHAQKNHIFLLEIFNKLKLKKKNAKLILIGTGPLETEIKKKVKKLNLENDVIFLGNISNVNELYQAMDVFVLPSLFEGLGIVAIEAQAAGLPVVTSTGVAKDAIVTSNIVQISLDAPIEEWVNTICEIKVNDKNLVIDNIKNAGYDIEENAKKMQEFYIDKYNLLNI